MSVTKKRGRPRKEIDMDIDDRSLGDSPSDGSYMNTGVPKTMSSLSSLNRFLPKSFSSPKGSGNSLTDNDPDVSFLPATTALQLVSDSQESKQRKRGRPLKSIISGKLIPQTDSNPDSSRTQRIGVNELKDVDIDISISGMGVGLPSEISVDTDTDSPKKNFLASLNIISPEVLDKIQKNYHFRKRLKQQLRPTSNETDSQSSDCFLISDNQTNKVSTEDSYSSQSKINQPRKRGRPRKGSSTRVVTQETSIENNSVDLSSPSDFDNPMFLTSPDSVINSPCTPVTSPSVHSSNSGREKRHSKLPLKFRDSSFDDPEISFLCDYPNLKNKTGKRGRPRKYPVEQKGGIEIESSCQQNKMALQYSNDDLLAKKETKIVPEERDSDDDGVIVNKQPTISIQANPTNVLKASMDFETNQSSHVSDPKDIVKIVPKKGRPSNYLKDKITENFSKTDMKQDYVDELSWEVEMLNQRKRGRPKKSLSTITSPESESKIEEIEDEVKEQNNSESSSPRKRGRPRKSEEIHDKLNHVVDPDQRHMNMLDISFPRKRGRPRKSIPADVESQKEISTPKKRGRPRKSDQTHVCIDKGSNQDADRIPSEELVSDISFQKKRGRPRKSDDSSTSNLSINSKLNSKRGRPRKSTGHDSQYQQENSNSDVEEGEVCFKGIHGRPNLGSPSKKTPGPKKKARSCEDQDVVFDCKRCGEKFPSRQEITKHMMFEHQALWTAECPEGSTTRRALLAVLKVAKKLTCQKCGKSQRFIHAYLDHIEWCGREHITYTCEVCGHSGLMLKWKKIHMREHQVKEKAATQAASKEEELGSADKQRNAAKKAIKHLKNVQKELEKDETRNPSGGDDDSDAEAVVSEEHDDDDDEEHFAESEVRFQANRSRRLWPDAALLSSQIKSSPPRENEGNPSPISDIAHRFWEEKYESPFVSSLLCVEKDMEALSRPPVIVKTEELVPRDGLEDLGYMGSSILDTICRPNHLPSVPSTSQEDLSTYQLAPESLSTTVSIVNPAEISTGNPSTTSNVHPNTISTVYPTTISTVHPNMISTVYPMPISTLQPATVQERHSTSISTLQPVPINIYNNNCTNCIQVANPSTLSLSRSTTNRTLSRCDVLEMQCKLLESEYKNSKLLRRKLKLQINLLIKKSEELGIHVLYDSSDSE